MARIHPAALNMAFTTPGYDQPRRCRCWIVLSIILAAIAYFALMGTLAHI